MLEDAVRPSAIERPVGQVEIMVSPTR
jgi:hypothetical protein